MYRERYDRGSPAASCGERTGLEAVGHSHARLDLLVQVAVRIDAAGHHEQPGCIDLVPRRETVSERDYAPAPDPDVTLSDVGGGDHRSTLDDEVKIHRTHLFPIRR